MVAKKTAVQHSASGRSTGAAARGANGVQPEKAAKAAAKKTTAKKATAKKTANKTVTKAATKTVTKAATKTVTKAATKTVTKAATKTATKAAAEKTVAKKGAVKKTVAKKATAKKTAAEKAVPAEAAPPAKKTAAKKSTARKSTAKKTAATAADGAAQAAETTGATTVVAKKTPGTATAAKKPTAVPKARVAAAEPGELAVRPGEDPWTPEEVGEARAELQSEALRLGSEISSSEDALVGLMRDSGDGAGHDDADTGTKNITREHEMSLAANAREMLEQTQRALERLDAGTYGICENCGNPIGKARMQAFPRATLCVECKQKQERRS
ncbi:TraR/DksA C4-type zinc finger protein [Streptomyces sp. MZ04]|uniref:TraR/DksA family transcriptional regulator n=1 Tax=Streptomyces sp. MZ04 TaxID=2559236 RepID=UPI00107ECBE2|nr:TraR/DksA C4-type zinc finger protein [Streptomyces sp. MZ04]TGB14077.1 hypothetical protein E2651_07400 [Streptomyces sp. MZ04]